MKRLVFPCAFVPAALVLLAGGPAAVSPAFAFFTDLVAEEETAASLMSGTSMRGADFSGSRKESAPKRAVSPEVPKPTQKVKEESSQSEETVRGESSQTDEAAEAETPVEGPEAAEAETPVEGPEAPEREAAITSVVESVDEAGDFLRARQVESGQFEDASQYKPGEEANSPNSLSLALSSVVFAFLSLVTSALEFNSGKKSTDVKIYDPTEAEE